MPDRLRDGRSTAVRHHSLSGGHVSCPSPLAWTRRGIAGAGLLILGSACGVLPLRGGSLVRFRAPSIVVAYPERGAALPADRALITLRFAAGEPGDPIDVSSFRATLDGVDRSALFQVTDTEAWGRLDDGGAPSGAPAVPGIAAGPHTLGARICSVRGACGALTFAVSVQPWERALDAAARGAMASPSARFD